MEHDLSIETQHETDSTTEDLILGSRLGRLQAFGIVAGKTAAAQVDCIREIRDRRLYKRLSPSWDAFCTDVLGSSRAAINRQIQQLETYGPRFFTLTQFTRIPPAAFDAIAPYLTDDALTLDGQSFALTAENAQQIALAVSELRQRAAADNPKPETPPEQRIEKQVRSLIASLAEYGITTDGDRRAAVSSLLSHLMDYATDPAIAA